MKTTAKRTATRVKRTYNLSQASVNAVKRLADESGVASSQDAVVERAITDLDRRVRDARDALLWRQSAQDSGFVTEMQQLADGFMADDTRAWQL